MAGNSALGMRRGAFLAAGLLVLAACTGSSADPTTSTTSVPTTEATTTTTTTSTTTTSTTTTSTTEAPTTTTVDPPARPDKLVSNFDRASVEDFDTTGDDIYRIALELDDLYNYFEGNPADTVDEMLDLMFTDDHRGLAAQRQSLGELVDNNWHYVDPGIRIVALELLEYQGDRAVFREVSERGEQQIADESGDIAKTYPGWNTHVYEYTLERGSDGRWRWAIPGAPELITEEELAQMVPVEWVGRH